MRIELVKVGKCASRLSDDCEKLIERLTSCTEADLYHELSLIQTWDWGKCELLHWIDVLNLFDGYLAEACGSDGSAWLLPCDAKENKGRRKLLLAILQFTALLIENSFGRHLYNSMEYLTQLLSSSDMEIVLQTLNLIYVLSKINNFIAKLCHERRQYLLDRLTPLAEKWGGPENGFGLEEYCRSAMSSTFRESVTTVHFKYHVDPGNSERAVVGTIHREQVHTLGPSAGHIMMTLLRENPCLPEHEHMRLFSRIVVANCCASYERRLQCLQARLVALSTLLHCTAIPNTFDSLLHEGLIEELVDVIELLSTYQAGSHDELLIGVRTAALRTLTAIIHLDGNPKLEAIITTTGAAYYLGLLPSLLRSCVQKITHAGGERQSVSSPRPGTPDRAFETALFAFLFHLSSDKSGCEALVNGGVIPSLLKVLDFDVCLPQDSKFVAKAVRLIARINHDKADFERNGCIEKFIGRLEHEIKSSLAQKEPLDRNQALVIEALLETIKDVISDDSLESGSLQNSIRQIIRERKLFGERLYFLATQLPPDTLALANILSPIQPRPQEHRPSEDFVELQARYNALKSRYESVLSNLESASGSEQLTSRNWFMRWVRGLPFLVKALIIALGCASISLVLWQRYSRAPVIVQEGHASSATFKRVEGEPSRTDESKKVYQDHSGL